MISQQYFKDNLVASISDLKAFLNLETTPGYWNLKDTVQSAFDRTEHEDYLYCWMLGKYGELGVPNILEMETLRLQYIKAPFLPDELGSLTNLTNLEIGPTGFTTFPIAIGRLTQLQVLSLRQNKLSYLPDTIRDLTSLRTLNISENHLRELPAEALERIFSTIATIPHLGVLTSFDNDFTVLPQGISLLTTLHTINICRNRLTSISPNM